MSKKLFTGADVEALFKAGKTAADIPKDAILTPSARDIIRDAAPRSSGVASSAGSKDNRFPPLPPGVPTVPPVPVVPSFEYSWVPGGDAITPEDIQRFFYSPAIVEIKRQMVHVGHKMWGRNMVDGNGGNITVRVGDNLVLCTPTLRSKGELQVDDIALVDLEGTQKAGWRKRTSEVNTHIAIMKQQPLAKCCIHGHPPYSTAFAVAGIEPPTCLCSEAEIFTGPIKLIPYQTPGSVENAEAVGAVAKDNPAVLLENHGVMTWGTDAEDAYWKLENMETACQTIWVASQLNGGKLHAIPFEKMQDIFKIRRQLGMVDPREEWTECKLCDNSEFIPGAVCQVPDSSTPSSSAKLDPDAEKLVQMLTDQILAATK
ncbi:MAG: class II aldolase/adducin family protein [Akkermansiaceae bacterium]|jgi:L-fuculose-phosphate aldolase|nr:class II aldolase/adducin family protein [Akkermansiaceae bacterium]MDP4647448.1 class II aldolase/adducin family protein [Akkermansiaceae bacterium]MDP4721696.1 class II aldolase/adducin family protein [Akkermansiaceae bacterium]MDP4781593.1 class II aldolase/adducin family protein [Akkermansiaceae bacterium]MDP4848054.1 class II aldolase/adducin family protein [Akkermansiaceae bacterium]